MTSLANLSIGTDHLVLIEEINNRLLSAYRLLSDGTETNIPDRAFKIDTSDNKLYQRDVDLGDWVEFKLASIADNAVTASVIAADSVTGSKILLDNNQYLRGKLAAGTAHDVLALSTNDDIIFNAPAAKTISIRQGGTSRYAIGLDILPAVTNTQDLGSSSLKFAEVHSTALKSCNLIDGAGVPLVIGTTDSQPITLKINNTNQVTLSTSKELHPITTNTGALGTSSIEWANGYIRTVNSSTALALKGATTEVYTNNLRRATWDSSGHLLPEGDFALRLGGSSNHFSQVHTASINKASGNIDVVPAAGSTVLWAQNTARVACDSSAFRPLTDNAITSGASGSEWSAVHTRALRSANALTIGSTASSTTFQSNGVTRMQLSTDGNLLFTNLPTAASINLSSVTQNIVVSINGGFAAIPAYAFSF